MWCLAIFCSLAFCSSALAAPSPQSSPNAGSSELTKRSQGRECDMPGQYADWVDVGHAIEHWCSNHAGQSMAKGTKIDDGDIGGFWVQGKNPHRAKLHVKYQNDHIAQWDIDGEACNWYLKYIMQGCTPGGDKPNDIGRQFVDGGTYYEPKMGSIDMQILDQD